MSASNRFARSHYFHRGYLTVRLEESAKHARLELTQSGRLEQGFYRVSTALIARFHERLSSLWWLRYFSLPREIVSRLWSSGRVTPARYKSSDAFIQFYATRVAFSGLDTTAFLPANTRRTHGDAVLFYAIVYVKFVSTSKRDGRSSLGTSKSTNRQVLSSW